MTGIVCYNIQAVRQTARWSSGQDASLSRWKRGFDSPTGHQKNDNFVRDCRFFFLFTLSNI